MAFASSDEDAYELLRDNGYPRSLQRGFTNLGDREAALSSPWTQRGLRSFITSDPSSLAILSLGTLLVLTPFTFTYWLSLQNLSCPAGDWALDCSVSEDVRFFGKYLAQTQGVVSTIFSVGLSMMAYILHRVAETTIWPVLATTALSLRDIDRYLATSRGSLTTAPSAIWRARGFVPVAVLLIVTTAITLQLAVSVIIGHAYTLVNVTNTFTSGVASGGGAGLHFIQYNPPAMLPGAVSEALSLYNSWAGGMSQEPMPDQRGFVIDRANLSAVGDFSALAIETQMSINCSARPINITAEEDWFFTVRSSMYGDTLLRLQPKLTLWVDKWYNVSEVEAITTIMFAAIDGTIEGGYANKPTPLQATENYSGISTLACDVDVRLVDSSLCTLPDPQKCPEPTVVLSEVESFSSGGAPGQDVYYNAVWFGAAVSVFGVSVSGAQPAFSVSIANDNESYSYSNDSTVQLPIPWTTWASPSSPPEAGELPTDSYNFSLAAVENFIRVSSGALAMTMMRHFPAQNSTLPSTLPMLQLHPSRTFIILMPPAVMLGCIVFVMLLSAWMHKRANIHHIQLGDVGEIIVNSQTNDVRAIVNEVRRVKADATTTPIKVLKRGRKGDTVIPDIKLRYGLVPEGYMGLARPKSVKCPYCTTGQSQTPYDTGQDVLCPTQSELTVGKLWHKTKHGPELSEGLNNTARF